MSDYGLGIKDPLWFVGVIENNDDPRKEGRVQVRAFGIHGTNKDVETEDLPWAICIHGGYDVNIVPKTNSWVFGFFMDGRGAQQPWCNPKSNDESFKPRSRWLGSRATN